MQKLKNKNSSSFIVVSQIRSSISLDKKRKNTLFCLGLGKIGNSSKLKNNDSILGMCRKVSHLINFKNL